MNLKNKIYLMNFFTAIIPIMIISIIAYFIFSVKIKELEENKIRLINQTIEKTLNEKISDSVEMLIYLADIYENKDKRLENIYKGGGNEERQKHMLDHMRELSNLESSAKFIAYGTAEKQMFFDDNAEDQHLSPDYDPTIRPWYIGAVNSKDYYLSDIFIHMGTGEPIVTISKKIEFDGKIVGVLVVVLDLSMLSKNLSEYKIGKSGSFFILDRNNKILIDTGNNEENYKYISHMNLFNNGYSEFEKYTPVGKVHYHVHKLEKLNLTLVGSVQDKDIYRSIYKLRNYGLMIILATIILITIFLSIFSKNFNRSLDRLFYVINSIASGNYTKNIDKLMDLIDEKNELKFIKEALKNMNYEVIKRETELKLMSETDSLTKIYNRRAIISFIEIEIERSKNFELEYTLIMFDLDRFKKLNDRFGHLFGDEVLRKVCKIILKNIKTTDRFGRCGGEEFLILLPNTKLYEGRLIADRLRKKIEKMTWKNDVRVTVSMGVIKNMKMDTLESLLERVDNLLYKAKNSGRNRIES